MKGDHLVRAFHNAMNTGRIEDASAILEECLFPPSAIGHILTGYYSVHRVYQNVGGAILERVRPY